MGQAGQRNNDNNLDGPSGVPVMALTGTDCPGSNRVWDSTGTEIGAYLIDDCRGILLSRVSHKQLGVAFNINAEAQHKSSNGDQLAAPRHCSCLHCLLDVHCSGVPDQL